MFNIGDKIVYPLHGAGTIVAIEEKEILGNIKQYFIIAMPIGDMKISVPVDNVEEIGVREVFDKSDLPLVFDVLKGDMSKMSDNWSRRYRENLDKIRTGDILEIAAVVRNLTIRDDEKSLSTGEKKMLNNALKMLISELIIVNGKSKEETEDLVEKAIRNE